MAAATLATVEVCTVSEAVVGHLPWEAGVVECPAALQRAVGAEDSPRKAQPHVVHRRTVVIQVDDLTALVVVANEEGAVEGKAGDLMVVAVVGLGTGLEGEKAHSMAGAGVAGRLKEAVAVAAELQTGVVVAAVCWKVVVVVEVPSWAAVAAVAVETILLAHLEVGLRFCSASRSELQQQGCYAVRLEARQFRSARGRLHR